MAQTSLPENGLLYRFILWSQDNWPTLLTLFGTIGTVVCAAWLSILAVQAIPDARAAQAARNTLLNSWAFRLLVVSSLLIVAGNFMQLKQSKRTSDLERKLDEATRQCEEKEQRIQEQSARAEMTYSSTFEQSLTILMNSVLQLTSEERVTLYKHDGSQFVQVARFSDNPAYCAKGRGIYPDDQGCIMEAWRSGASSFTVPDPSTHWNEYLAEHRKKNIDEKTVSGFTMRSREYKAFAIHDIGSNRKVAVLVFESMLPEGLKKARLETIMKHEGRRIAGLMETMRFYEPSVDLARKTGF